MRSLTQQCDHVKYKECIQAKQQRGICIRHLRSPCLCVWESSLCCSPPTVPSSLGSLRRSYLCMCGRIALRSQQRHLDTVHRNNGKRHVVMPQEFDNSISAFIQGIFTSIYYASNQQHLKHICKRASAHANINCYYPPAANLSQNTWNKYATKQATVDPMTAGLASVSKYNKIHMRYQALETIHGCQRLSLPWQERNLMIPATWSAATWSAAAGHMLMMTVVWNLTKPNQSGSFGGGTGSQLRNACLSASGTVMRLAGSRMKTASSSSANSLTCNVRQTMLIICLWPWCLHSWHMYASYWLERIRTRAHFMLHFRELQGSSERNLSTPHCALERDCGGGKEQKSKNRKNNCDAYLLGVVRWRSDLLQLIQNALVWLVVCNLLDDLLFCDDVLGEVLEDQVCSVLLEMLVLELSLLEHFLWRGSLVVLQKQRTKTLSP